MIHIILLFENNHELLGTGSTTDLIAWTVFIGLLIPLTFLVHLHFGLTQNKDTALSPETIYFR